MATIFTGTDNDGVTVVQSGDTYVTARGDLVLNDGIAFDIGAFQRINYFLRGDIFASDTGIFSDNGSAFLRIVIGEGAALNAGNNGITLTAGPGVGTFNTVVNQGSIVSTVGNGIAIQADSNEVITSGFVSGGASGIFMQGFRPQLTNTGDVFGATGLNVSGDAARIANEGVVSAGLDGIQAAGDDLEIVNSGSVLSRSNGIEVFGSGAINNSGLIDATNRAVIFNGADDDTGRLQNTGTITVATDDASAFAYVGSDGIDTIVNNGAIVGRVSMAGGDDVFRGQNGTLSGDLLGGDGNDTLDGGDGQDRFFGGDDDDVVRGFAGDDRLDGDGGADELRGGKGQDDLRGGASADVIFGGAGDDTLRGGNGTDILYGGKGDDLLLGGFKADVFVFARSAGDDVILGFQNGADQIDVSAFGLSNFGQLAPAVTQVSGNTVIDWTELGGEGQLILAGETGTINGADFIF